MTYLDLIRSSLRLIGQLGPGRGPNGSEITDALYVLNSMLDAWNIEHLNVYQIARAVYPLTASKPSYTIGPGGDFDTIRPVRIESAGIIYSYTPIESPIQVITDQRWAAFGGPTRGLFPLPAGAPTVGVYYDDSYPLGTLYLRPALTMATQLALYTWAQLTQVADESVSVSFPPGYADAIRYNLAVRLAPEWGRMPRADVQDLAVQSKAAIKSINMQPVEMDASDGGALACGGVGMPFNIYTG